MFDVRCSRFAVQGSRFNVRLSGRILIQLPCGWKRSSPSPSPKEERAGERRPLLLNAPHPNPLPARSSRGEGENFWWLYPDARERQPSGQTTTVVRLFGLQSAG